MSIMALQITGVSIVGWGADQRKHRSSASMAFVQGIHQPTQNAGNMENVSTWWCNHELYTLWKVSKHPDIPK